MDLPLMAAWAVQQNLRAQSEEEPRHERQDLTPDSKSDDADKTSSEKEA